MNAWFDRLGAAVAADLGAETARSLDLTRDEAMELLELARDVAHGSGARQFAPLVTYLAGRLVAGSDTLDRDRVLAALTRAVRSAGPAGPGDPL